MIFIETRFLVSTYSKHLYENLSNHSSFRAQFGDFDPKGLSQVQVNDDGSLIGNSKDGEFKMWVNDPDVSNRILDDLRDYNAQAVA